MIGIKAYENNILLSCLHGNKILKNNFVNNEEQNENYKKNYTHKGKINNTTIGKYFDMYI